VADGRRALRARRLSPFLQAANDERFHLFLTSSRDLAGGTFEVTTDGIRWEAGSWLTPGAKVRGAFRLSWAEIRSIQVEQIPFKINALGGELVIVMEDGGRTIRGEFVGSRSALSEAISFARAESDPGSRLP
jgi:hypothetical protein